jgi:hypothetical protein
MKILKRKWIFYDISKKLRVENPNKKMSLMMNFGVFGERTQKVK